MRHSIDEGSRSTFGRTASSTGHEQSITMP
jgi:hypothetical protein